MFNGLKIYILCFNTIIKGIIKTYDVRLLQKHTGCWTKSPSQKVWLRNSPSSSRIMLPFNRRVSEGGESCHHLNTLPWVSGWFHFSVEVFQNSFLEQKLSLWLWLCSDSVRQCDTWYWTLVSKRVAVYCVVLHVLMQKVMKLKLNLTQYQLNIKGSLWSPSTAQDFISRQGLDIIFISYFMIEKSMKLQSVSQYDKMNINQSDLINTALFVLTNCQTHRGLKLLRRLWMYFRHLEW